MDEQETGAKPVISITKHIVEKELGRLLRENDLLFRAKNMDGLWGVLADKTKDMRVRLDAGHKFLQLADSRDILLFIDVSKREECPMAIRKEAMKKAITASCTGADIQNVKMRTLSFQDVWERTEIPALLKRRTYEIGIAEVNLYYKQWNKAALQGITTDPDRSSRIVAAANYALRKIRLGKGATEHDNQLDMTRKLRRTRQPNRRGLRLVS